MNIDNIRNDTWLAESLVTVETSTTDIPMVIFIFHPSILY